MTTDNNITEGSDVVARLLNVLVSEVLLKVDSRINKNLIDLSNRISELERKLEDGLHPDNFPTEQRVRELIDDAVCDLDVERKIEDALCDLDVDSKVESAVGDLDLTDQVQEVISCMRSDAIHELIGDEVKEVINRMDLSDHVNPERVVRAGIDAILKAPQI